MGVDVMQFNYLSQDRESRIKKIKKKTSKNKLTSKNKQKQKTKLKKTLKKNQQQQNLQ